MADFINPPPWEGLRIGAAAAFGLRCRELCDSNPYGTDIPPPLDLLMSDLVTELWDQSFSQTEINSAFEGALAALGPYAAGEERRGDRSRRR